MTDPILVVMAAGMGSRFGGPKQMTAVDDEGQVILDYSVRDAVRAGFRRVVCVIKREMEADFRARVGDRLAAHCALTYAYQELADLPGGVPVPAGRVKPWGTGHAVWAARGALDGPFAVINADDFYGPGAFRALYGFLAADGADREHCLVTYRLRNTLTENGTVARGVCGAGPGGELLTVTEHTAIRGPAEAPACTEDGGRTWQPLDPDAPVSLNTWGFRPAFLGVLEERLRHFLAVTMPENPEKAEFYLPGAVNDALAAGTDRVRLLATDDVWHGVTYREDLPALREALAALRARGFYPENLWAGGV